MPISDRPPGSGGAGGLTRKTVHLNRRSHDCHVRQFRGMVADRVGGSFNLVIGASIPSGAWTPDHPEVLIAA